MNSAEFSTPDPCQILIVEDDQDLRDMMAQMLSIEGFDTSAVANGLEALDYLHRETRPHVILLDLMMPVMDGWEFRRRQKADPDLAPLPVIVLSALDPAWAPVDATAFLQKPLDFDHLLQLVRTHAG